MEALAEKKSINRYESYKDSEAKWLGNIPSHWNTLSNKNIFKLKKNQVGKRSSDYVLLSLTLNGVIKRDMENPQGKFPAEFDTYQEVKKGDFIFCLFDVEETPRCVGLSGFDGMITGAYTVMEPYQNFDRNFLYYFYLNLDADKRLKPLYTGLRNTISKENFFSFKTFVPPLPEQTAIAAFLDSKTVLIDQAIDIKQKQIELLKERRQILIHKAVTRGLNPNVKLKDSGVEWIGKMPDGWEVKRLKDVCLINLNSLPENTPNNLEFKYVDIGSVTLESGINNTEEYTFKNAPSRARRLAKEGDTVISTVRTYLKAIDFIDHVKASYIYSTGFAVLQPNEFMCPEFLGWFVRSDAFTEQVTVNSKGMSYPAINSTDIGRLTVVHCKFDEQKEIVEYIEIATTKIASAISLKEQEIEKLKEYKSTLINSAVTGKIKVG
jgi:type I restriction enzyme S subunit